jgi:hypothetical protein
VKTKKKTKFAKHKILITALIILAVVVSGFIYLIRRPSGTVVGGFHWGIAYSRIFSEQMGLDWRENYLAIVNDLRPEYLRLPVYWQDIEPEPGKFTWDYYDWMIDQAEKNKIKIILVIGRKTPRWPECNLPDWVNKKDLESQKDPVLNEISQIVERYKNRPILYAWQVENEPFLNFGECPLMGGDFLDQEIARVRQLDPNHPIVVTDSGELSYWVQAAKRADIFGTTMYLIVHSQKWGYLEYHLPPVFFWLKANIVHLFYPGKPITVSELQAEPWGPNLLYDISVDEMMKTMDFAQFQKNIEYSKEVGFPDIYLWGAEWWYWMKTVQGDARYWDYAKKVIHE